MGSDGARLVAIGAAKRIRPFDFRRRPAMRSGATADDPPGYVVSRTEESGDLRADPGTGTFALLAVAPSILFLKHGPESRHVRVKATKTRKAGEADWRGSKRAARAGDRPRSSEKGLGVSIPVGPEDGELCLGGAAKDSVVEARRSWRDKSFVDLALARPIPTSGQQPGLDEEEAAAAMKPRNLEKWAGGRRSEILVVVANIQMRTLKAKRGKGSMGVQEASAGALGKSYLFCLTACPPQEAARRRVGVQRLEETPRQRGVGRPAIENRRRSAYATPGRTHNRIRSQGKGSRQNGSVTGKGLARGAGHGVPVPNPSDCRWTARAAQRREASSSSRCPGDGLERPFGGLPGVEQPTSRLKYGQGESICLIKTKHCDGPCWDAHAM
ncbi:hypothetical protein H6P81_021733 [Aristolochia fimbriata]|uniref:Uncharacterized protein n=1 Tax=Aristolochia fimbriata TaxID=158543 RepID=A0AAV7DS04_ARIFI|nr:hypothetical protein H6P81_021733 [Aristolochia fimbriata]